MLKNHPKGLFVAFFANMGERFGYYTMLAIFVYYLQATFNFSATNAGYIYAGFLFAVYFLPLFGGMLADRALGYGKTITLGTLVLFLGYALLSIPGKGLPLLLVALFVIAAGTGLFKGNLQALVGNLYDEPKYQNVRDYAFNIFYMGINVGAFFAPSAATGAINWILGKEGFSYSARIVDLANRYLADNLQDTTELLSLAKAQAGAAFTNLTDFCNHYITSVSNAYSGAFAVAAVSMIVSMIIFILFRKFYKHADFTEKQKAVSEEHKDKMIKLSPKQVKDRLFALYFVFVVVMFFWMSFHQNGFTLSIFARDYTVSKVSDITYTFFSLKSFLPLILAILGLIFLLKKASSRLARIGGGILFVAGALVTYLVVNGYDSVMDISPQVFQHFNPIFIVFLTFGVIGFFSYLQKKGKEPSTPKKIGIGMIIAAISFGIMLVASIGLKSPKVLAGGVSDTLISPYWLISTYFIITIAELCLSPMGISFVSKVSPPQYKGTMQGGWLAATAVGNALAGLIGILWDRWELWQFFLFVIGMCLLSAALIFSVMKKLEKASES
ncbi:MAG: peptide MFS transporter [Candidatus Aminicenantes bacterium]|nr:peptide MFS transporter [Candidatus Aminicenantes bacterium]